MDTLKAINNYLDKMFGEVPGMKVLLLDGRTVRLAHPRRSFQVELGGTAG